MAESHNTLPLKTEGGINGEHQIIQLTDGSLDQLNSQQLSGNTTAIFHQANNNNGSGTTTLRPIQLPYDPNTGQQQYSMVYVTYPPLNTSLEQQQQLHHDAGFVTVHTGVPTTSTDHNGGASLLLTANHLAGTTQLLPQPLQHQPGPAGLHLAQQQLTFSQASIMPSSQPLLHSQPLHITTALNNQPVRIVSQTDCPPPAPAAIMLPLTTVAPPTTTTAVVSADSTAQVSNGIKIGAHKCDLCDRSFRMRCRLMAHKRRHTGERPFACEECGRGFSERGNLQRHRDTHSKERRFLCITCGKQFRQASCLSNHRRFHCAGASGRSCSYCTRSFRSASSLHMHIRWKHRDMAPHHSRTITSSSSVEKTMKPVAPEASTPATRIVAAIRPQPDNTMLLQTNQIFQQPHLVTLAAPLNNNNSTVVSGDLVAGVDFSTARHLLQPITVTSSSSGANSTLIINTRSSNFEEMKIEKEVKSLELLPLSNGESGTQQLPPQPTSTNNNTNMKVMTSSSTIGRRRDFHCDMCPRSFFFQCRLAAHMRSHTNVRPYACTECHRTFTQKGYLARHAAVHSSDRPFSCEACDRSYKHYGSLVNHRRVHKNLAAAADSSTGDVNHMDQITKQQLLVKLEDGTTTPLTAELAHAASAVLEKSGIGEEEQPTLHLLQPPPSFLIPASFFGHVPQA